MEQSYPVTCKGTHVGKVIVQRNGLYYHFSCRCHLADQTIYRLVVTVGTTHINLGVLVPMNGSFILNTKQPVKTIGEGEMSFDLVTKKEDCSVTFVPIVPEEPFSYISRLKDSFLELQDGQPGITIKETQEQ